MKAVALFVALLIATVAWGQQPESLFSPMPDGNANLGGPMRFTLLQRPSGRHMVNILFMWGGIHRSDAQKFRQALQASQAQELWLASEGGDLNEAIEIAHIVRAAGLTTRVPEGGPPPDGWECVSACNFIFLGGVVRYVDTGATFKVHVFALASVRNLRSAMTSPPTDLLTFTQRYPLHEAITPAVFLKVALALHEAIASNDKQKAMMLASALPSEFVEAIVEYREAHDNRVSCPTESSPPGPPSMQNAVRSLQGALGQIDQLKPMPKALPVLPGSPEQTAAPLPEPMKSAPERQPARAPVQGIPAGQYDPPAPPLGPPQAVPRQQTTPKPPPQRQQRGSQYSPQAADFPDDPCMEGALRHYLAVAAISEEIKNVQQSAAQQSAAIATFLTQMEVSLRFLTDFANIPNDKPRALTREELRSLNVVNAD